MKVLNLYAGIGGNRKLWKDVEVTAVEINESIAKFYSDHYPEDSLIIGDAKEYLLNNYYKFDFIWASYPCPSHSRARFWASAPNNRVKPVYPDMSLYEGILFMQHYYNGKWVAENVVPFYEPLIKPTAKVGRHLFWSNFNINPGNYKEADIKEGNINEWQELHGIDITGYEFTDRKDKILRNCVHPDLGLHILNRALDIKSEENIKQSTLF